MTISPLRLALTSTIAAGVALATLTCTASAAPVTGSTPVRTVQIVSTLTTGQRQCLRDAGATRPGAEASPEERQAAREAFRSAAELCGITLPDPRGALANLTDEQRQCLRDAGATRPARDATFAERRAARRVLESAADTCGITLEDLSGRGRLGSGRLATLTDEQRQCLRDAGAARPGIDATPAERLAARETLAVAAEQCGVTLPLS